MEHLQQPHFFYANQCNVNLGISNSIKSVFGLRKELPLAYYLTGFWFQRILGHNRDTPWMLHHTSTVYHPEKIVRGKNVFPGDSPGNFIDASYGIRIGDYTNLGPNVGLITKNHDPINNELYQEGKPIDIGKHCWIGMNAVVLPGITLGDFTIVGAGSVVTKSFPDGYSVIAGNPATVIRSLNKEECLQFAESKR